MIEEEAEEGVACSLCQHQLVPPVRVLEHPRLPELAVCALCHERDEHNSSSEEDDDMCFWCGEYDCGELLLCDECEKGYCTQCITSNLGENTLNSIMETDPWSCFACDPKGLAQLSAQFSSTRDIEYFPPSIDETRELLVKVENEFDIWDAKTTDEAEATLHDIRAEFESTANGKIIDESVVMEEYSTIQNIWKHHLDLLDFRRSELQDHYIDLGGDIKVFYSVLEASRGSSSQGEETDEERVGDDLPDPWKKAKDFVSVSLLENVIPPEFPSSDVNSAKQKKSHLEANEVVSKSSDLPAIYDDLSYYCRTSRETGIVISDIGVVPTAAERATMKSRARDDRVLQDVCEKEVSLAYLIQTPCQQPMSCFPSPTHSASSVNAPSIFPKIFEMHIPSDVLTYLFYTIGKVFPGYSEDFNIDDHINHSSSGEKDEIDKTKLFAEERTQIKDVVSRYCVPREILVVLKYINGSCKYMTYATPSWMKSHDDSIQSSSLLQSIGFQQEKPDEPLLSAHFSYNVAKETEDWQSWAMSSKVHPALMECIYRGHPSEWSCLVGKFGVPGDLLDSDGEDIEISTAEDSVKTYVKYCQDHHRPINREIVHDHLRAINEKENYNQHDGQECASTKKRMSLSKGHLSDIQDVDEDKLFFETRNKPKTKRSRHSSESHSNHHMSSSESNDIVSPFMKEELEKAESVKNFGGGDNLPGKTVKTIESESVHLSAVVPTKKSMNKQGEGHLSNAPAGPSSHGELHISTKRLNKKNESVKLNSTTGDSRNRRGTGNGEGSKSCPVCLDSESSESENENEFALLTPSSRCLSNASRDLEHDTDINVEEENDRVTRIRKRRRRSEGNRPEKSRTKYSPEIVVPTGHYLEPNSGKCLPFESFAINGLEISDLFGSDVFSPNTYSVLQSSHLKNREVSMHPILSTQLKPHQKEAVLFLWKNVMIGVLDYCSEDVKHCQENIEETDSTFKRKQKEATSRKSVHSHGCVLAHFMGLGKTLTLISFLTTVMKHPLLQSINNPHLSSKLKPAELILNRRKTIDGSANHIKLNETSTMEPSPVPTIPYIFRVLILVPVSVVFNWQAEFKTWLPDEYAKNMNNKLNYYVVSGGSCKDEAKHNLLKWGNKGGVCIMGYEQFTSYQALDYYKSILENPGPDIVVLDEAHRIKDDSSKLYKSLRTLRTKRRIALTGSPLQNNLLEYYHMVNFVKQGHLNSKKHFKKYFVDPIKEGEAADASKRAKKYMKGRLHVLSKSLAHIVDRKDISHLKSFLQPKREFILLTKLTDFQQYLYRVFLERISSMLQSEENVDCIVNEATSIPSSRNGGYLFSHAKVGMLIWNHPLCLPVNDFLNPDQARKGNLIQPVPSFDILAKKLNEIYRDFLIGKPVKEVASQSTKKVDAEVILSNPMLSANMISFGSKKSITSNDEEGNTDIDNSAMLIEGIGDWWRNNDAKSNSSGGGVSSLSRPTVPALGGLSKVNILALGNKIVLFLSILTESIQRHDKVVLFSQSLATLTFIEIILKSNWGSLIDSLMETSPSSLSSHKNMNENNGKTKRNFCFGTEEESLRSKWIKGRDYFRFDGSIKGSERQEMIDTFNKNSKSRLFLVSTRAGNMGSNLQSGNRVIIFDASWNPVHDLQAIFRCYRFGQTKPVYVYRFLAAGTLEEVIYKRQMNKMALAARVVDAHMPLSHFAQEEYENITQCYTAEETEDDKGDRLLEKVRPEDDIVLHMVLKRLGGNRILKDLEDMDPMLEDIEDEHLDENEKWTAERAYEAEISAAEKIANMSTLIHLPEKSAVDPSQETPLRSSGVEQEQCEHSKENDVGTNKHDNVPSSNLMSNESNKVFSGAGIELISKIETQSDNETPSPSLIEEGENTDKSSDILSSAIAAALRETEVAVSIDGKVNVDQEKGVTQNILDQTD